MKKTLAIVLMVLCVFSAFAQGATEGTTATDDQVKVVLLTDATGIDDKSFNAAFKVSRNQAHQPSQHT